MACRSGYVLASRCLRRLLWPAGQAAEVRVVSRLEVGGVTYLGSVLPGLSGVADLVASDGEFDFALLPLDRVRDLYEAGRWWEREWDHESVASGVARLRRQVLDGEVDYFLHDMGGGSGRKYACFAPNCYVGGPLIRFFQEVCGLNRAPAELLTRRNAEMAVEWVRIDLREQLAWKVSSLGGRMRFFRLEGWDGCAVVLGGWLSGLVKLSGMGVEAAEVDLAGATNIFNGSDEQLDRYGRHLFELAGLFGDPKFFNPLRLLPSMRAPESWEECYRDGEFRSDVLIATSELLEHLRVLGLCCSGRC